MPAAQAHQPTQAALRRLGKQLTDAIEQYEAAGRQDLADHEAAQLAVLKRYLPSELSDDELNALVAAAIAETGATGPKDMGRVMPVAMQRVAGRADGRRVNAAVKTALARDDRSGSERSISRSRWSPRRSRRRVTSDELSAGGIRPRPRRRSGRGLGDHGRPRGRRPSAVAPPGFHGNRHADRHHDVSQPTSLPEEVRAGSWRSRLITP